MANDIKSATNSIDGLKSGSNQVDAVYSGADLVWTSTDLRATRSYTNSSSLSLTGLGIEENDIVVLSTAGGTSSSDINSVGWTVPQNNTVTNNVRVTIAYKQMGPSPDTSIGFDANVSSACVSVWKRRTTTGAGLSAAATATSTSVDPNSRSVADNTVVLVLTSTDDSGATVTSPSSGYTNIVAAGGNESAAQLAKEKVASGTEDPGSLTWSLFGDLNAYTLELPAA